MKTPEPVETGSKWQHRNGLVYTVLFNANELDTLQYPASVVYQGANGKVWVKPLHNWHDSMTRLVVE